MKLDFAIFEPTAKDAATIRAILEFWDQRDHVPFTTKEILAGIKKAKRLAEWLKDKYSMVVLGDLLLMKNAGRWTCEPLIPETAHYYALRVLQEAAAKFGNRVVPSDDRQFILMVYGKRIAILGKKQEDSPSEILSFVKERLGRCGLETLRADVASIAEIWDIFDDFEFQKLMGRRP